MVIRSGRDPMFLERGGTVLGIMDGAAYEEERLPLHAGDLVVLYTDGISEAVDRHGELYGDARLCELVRGLSHDLSAREVSEQIFAALRGFMDGEEARDDMTLMVIRVLEPERAPADDGGRQVVSQRQPVGA
jgi:sigma-B regulation protein RsbU (phosphoserine phosphatase)